MSRLLNNRITASVVAQPAEVARFPQSTTSGNCATSAGCATPAKTRRNPKPLTQMKTAVDPFASQFYDHSAAKPQPMGRQNFLLKKQEFRGLYYKWKIKLID